MLPLRYILTPVYKISNFLRTSFGKKYLNYFEHPPSAKNSIAQQILVPKYDRLLGYVKKFMTQFYRQVTPVQEAMSHYLLILF